MRWLAVIAITAVVGFPATAPVPAFAQTPDENALYAKIGKHFQAGEYGKAIPYAERYAELMKQRYGAWHPRLAAALNNLALLYDRQGRFQDAEPLYRHALSIKEKTLAPSDPSLGTAFNNMASLYERMGRYAEAEPLYRKALALWQKLPKPDNRSIALVLSNLAGLYVKQGRLDDAGKLHKQSLALKEKTLGPDDPTVGVSYNNLASVYDKQGHYKAAAPLYKRAAEIFTKSLGPNHIRVASVLANLSGVYTNQGRYAEAEPGLMRALAIYKRTLGPKHPLVATAYGNIGNLKERQGHLDEAEPLYKSALAIMEETRGREHPTVATVLTNLSYVDLGRKRWDSAYRYARRAAAIYSNRALAGIDQYRSDAGGARERARYFRNAVSATWRLQQSESNKRTNLTFESFVAAQWASQTSAAAALGQMATRLGGGSPKLAASIRELQDLSKSWATVDARLIAAIGAQDEATSGTLRASLRKTEEKMRTLAERLEEQFPEYAELANPKPLTPKAVRKLIGADEALVLFLVDAHESFVWTVTREAVTWAIIPLAREKIDDAIGALRKSLDPIAALQSSTRGFTREDACRGLAKIGKSCGSYDTDLQRAHDLYKDLLGPVADAISGKTHLTVVPSGPLTGLPFHMLLSAPPPAIRDRDRRLQQASWLIRDHTVTVLPSVSSLRALREFAKQGRAEKPFIGIGNPDFVKPSDRARRREPGKVAATMRGYASYFRGALADVDALSGAILPLPDTEDELRAVAKSLKAGKDDLLLGRTANESKVKALSRKGRLDDYRVVHFATHGLISGEIEGLGEPALALSLPDKATTEDDGLLTTSEVAELRLNADWVVLSACNTAAGAKPGAEAFSGLARAFFYSGARALLVSHWPVVSGAAVKLIRSTFSALREDLRIGRAEALRRAMLAMIDKGQPNERHPSYWAPFVVVGDGTP